MKKSRRCGLRNSLVMLTETPEQRERRREAVRGVVRKAFAAALFHLGDKEARTLASRICKFSEAARRPEGTKAPRQRRRVAADIRSNS